METSTGVARSEATAWQRRCLLLTNNFIYLCTAETDAHSADAVPEKEERVGEAAGAAVERVIRRAGKVVDVLPFKEIVEVASAAEWDFERNKTVLRFCSEGAVSGVCRTAC